MLEDLPLKKVVPRQTLFDCGGYRNLDCLTGILSLTKGEWMGHTGKDIVIARFHILTLEIGIGESEYEAKANMITVGSSLLPMTPSTREIIDFFHWAVDEDQILEFIDF